MIVFVVCILLLFVYQINGQLIGTWRKVNESNGQISTLLSITNGTISNYQYVEQEYLQFKLTNNYSESKTNITIKIQLSFSNLDKYLEVKLKNAPIEVYLEQFGQKDNYKTQEYLNQMKLLANLTICPGKKISLVIGQDNFDIMLKLMPNYILLMAIMVVTHLAAGAVFIVNFFELPALRSRQMVFGQPLLSAAFIFTQKFIIQNLTFHAQFHQYSYSFSLMVFVVIFDFLYAALFVSQMIMSLMNRRLQSFVSHIITIIGFTSQQLYMPVLFILSGIEIVKFNKEKVSINPYINIHLRMQNYETDWKKWIIFTELIVAYPVGIFFTDLSDTYPFGSDINLWFLIWLILLIPLYTYLSATRKLSQKKRLVSWIFCNLFSKIKIIAKLKQKAIKQEQEHESQEQN